MPDMDFFQSFMRQQQEQLRKKYAIMNEYAKKGEVLLVGSSLMEHFPLNELAQSMGLTTVVYNRGIGGYKTMDLWNAREECIFGLKPRKIFINIGTNDIGDHAYRQEKLLEEYRMLLTEIKTRLPETTVYVMAYYPVNTVDEFGLPKERHTDLFLTRTN
jgi:lysophospholipase L1-like esterase